MIDAKGFIFEKDNGKKSEHNKRNSFLNHLQLPQIKWSAIFIKPYAIGWHLKRIFEQRNAPTDQYNAHQTYMIKPSPLFKF